MYAQLKFVRSTSYVIHLETKRSLRRTKGEQKILC